MQIFPREKLTRFLFSGLFPDIRIIFTRNVIEFNARRTAPPVQFAKLATFESLILIMRPSLSNWSRTPETITPRCLPLRINNVAEKKEKKKKTQFEKLLPSRRR